MDEPSLLDYLRERLNLRSLLHGRADLEIEAGNTGDPEKKESGEEEVKNGVPWRPLSAIMLALIAQRFFEPGAETPIMGIGFYLIAVGVLLLSLLKREWQLLPVKPQEAGQPDSSYRGGRLIVFVLLLVATFLAFSGNQFTGLNMLLWTVTFIAALTAFWSPIGKGGIVSRLKDGITGFFKGSNVRIGFNWWNLLVLLVFLVSAWFHLSRLSTVPLEMTSDHTEKLLDISEVLNGNSSIFFARNSGREPIQFYLAAALVRVFGLGLDFTLLKLSMALAFLFSLVYVYKLGREVGNRWTGLLALLFTGIAAWTNILARSGMRLVLTPAFVAPVLYYLLRGLRLSRRNDLILSGVFIGLGMLGYSAFRVMPLVVLAIFAIHLFYDHQPRRIDTALGGLGVMGLFAIVGSLPLLRYAVQYPQAFTYRMATRMTGVEQSIQGSVFHIFLQNMLKAFAMPFWRDGNTWIISVINRPALDLVTGALYLLGVVFLLFAWRRQKNWQYLVLLVSIPLLMLPSILALAFPDENPSLSRAGGAVIPVILVAVLALQTLLLTLWRLVKRPAGRVAIGLFAGLLLVVSGAQNRDLVFTQYDRQYRNATWNTSQMGSIARDYIDTIGHPDTVWVVAVPYWVDTRLVAINAGYLGRDYQIWAKDLEYTLDETRSKLFFVKADDSEGMVKLMSLYPNGFSQLHSSEIPGRDFYTFVVPPATAGFPEN